MPGIENLLATDAVLPEFKASGLGSLHNQLQGILESYSFSASISLEDSETVETVSEIIFRGRLEYPQEWRGLEVQGLVRCQPVQDNMDKFRAKDGRITLGILTFSPATSGLVLRQSATPELFKAVKELLIESEHRSSWNKLFVMELAGGAGKLNEPDNWVVVRKLDVRFIEGGSPVTEPRPKRARWIVSDRFSVSVATFFLLAGFIYGVVLPLYTSMTKQDSGGYLPGALGGLSCLILVILHRLESVLEEMSS